MIGAKMMLSSVFQGDHTARDRRNYLGGKGARSNNPFIALLNSNTASVCSSIVGRSASPARDDASIAAVGGFRTGDVRTSTCHGESSGAGITSLEIGSIFEYLILIYHHKASAVSLT